MALIVVKFKKLPMFRYMFKGFALLKPFDIISVFHNPYEIFLGALIAIYADISSDIIMNQARILLCRPLTP